MRQHGTVESYITKFRSVTVLIPDLSLAEALDRFKRGLNREVLIAVELQGFSTLEECQRLAERVDTITSLHRGSHRPPSYPQSRFSSPDAYPVPMELEAALPPHPPCALLKRGSAAHLGSRHVTCSQKHTCGTDLRGTSIPVIQQWVLILQKNRPLGRGLL